MEDLLQLMRRVLSNSFLFYVKAQNYHWNVEGNNFPQYHEFFGCIYKEVYDSIDTTGEEIRALDDYAPGTLKRFIELSDLSEEVVVPSLQQMLVNLNSDNNIILTNLIDAFKKAEQYDRIGLADYLSARIDAHRKHAWMLKACMKEV